MSDKCTDPSCFEHGNSPQAKALRQMEAEIKSNEELVSMIRILAANTVDTSRHALEIKGYPVSPLTDMRMRAILAGDLDQDPVVQGIIRGLVVLATGSHEPTKILMAETSKVKEAPYVVERLCKAVDETETRTSQGPTDDFMAELMAFLKERLG